jgi:hypothetical protein
MKRTILVKYSASNLFSFNHDTFCEHVEDVLEEIYGMFNHGSGCESDIFLNSKTRSLSVNDCVSVDGQWYQCRSIGWQMVNAEYVNQLEEAVANHPLIDVYGSWWCLMDVMSKK